MMKRLLVALAAALALCAYAAVTPLPGVTPQRAPALSPFASPAMSARLAETFTATVRASRAAA